MTSNVFCESIRNKLETQDILEERAGTKNGITSDLNRSSVYATSITAESSLQRKGESSKCMRLSVTDLLKRVEDQSKISATLFPLIDKEKYHKKRASSDDSLEDISAYFDSYSDMIQKSRSPDHFGNIGACAEQSSGQHAAEADALLCESGQMTKKDDFSSTDKRTRKISLPVVVVKRSSLPPADWPTGYDVGPRTSMDCSIFFGVHIEYMFLSNQLKVNVKRLGNLPSEYGKRKVEYFIAKVCLLPGNTHKQKVKVTNGFDTSLNKPTAYLRGLSTVDLTQREIGVAIYVKQGFFRKQRLIHEWSIPMENVDLIEPQTAWKKIDCQL